MSKSKKARSLPKAITPELALANALTAVQGAVGAISDAEKKYAVSLTVTVRNLERMARSLTKMHERIDAVIERQLKKDERENDRASKKGERRQKLLDRIAQLERQVTKMNGN